MRARRVVPNVRIRTPRTQDDGTDRSADGNTAFYGMLGFEVVMDHGWIMTLASPSAPTAQISFMTRDQTAPVPPDLSVEVDDVDAAYAAVLASGAEIVHPLQDEEWGVRRFFVRDPNGLVVNVLAHRAP